MATKDKRDKDKALPREVREELAAELDKEAEAYRQALLERFREVEEQETKEIKRGGSDG